MSLKAKYLTNAPIRGASGFILDTPPSLHFSSEENMRTAVKEQAECTALIDARVIEDLDIEGRIPNTGQEVGTDLRLSKAAFGDLCNFCKVPVSFIKRRSKINEGLAIEILRDCLSHEFLSSSLQLVVDTRTGRVDGIVGQETYSPISNLDVLDFTLTALPGLSLSGGWLEGPNMRLTTLARERPVEVQVGDVVHFGSTVSNSINGDGSVVVDDYNERLVCTNGMVRRDPQFTQRVIHRGDIEFNVQRAVVISAGRAPELAKVMQRSAYAFLQAAEIRSLRAFVADPRHGGNPSLDEKVTKAALRGAQSQGLGEGEVTLWNFVNGITEAAHDTESVKRRQELEAMAYRTLSRYGAGLV